MRHCRWPTGINVKRDLVAVSITATEFRLRELADNPFP
jgi:hypothetical protein